MKMPKNPENMHVIKITSQAYAAIQRHKSVLVEKGKMWVKTSDVASSMILNGENAAANMEN